MTRRYRVLDVFTDRPLAGNPLAVVLDGDGLDEVAMQALAREFNLPETVFVMPAEHAAHSARLRIFTPARELPFAGHPTLGTAVCLAVEKLSGSEASDAVIVLEEAVGVVRCAVTLKGGLGFAEFDCPKLPERTGAGVPKELVADALGLHPAEVGFENHVPSRWSAGLEFHFIPVRNMAALAKAAAAAEYWRPAFGSVSAYLYTRETEGYGHAFRARMFGPGIGIAEDPATGSAVAAIAGPVHEFDALPEGRHSAIIEQGYEMGRPSLIHLNMVVSGSELATVRIGGHAVPVTQGTLAI